MPTATLAEACREETARFGRREPSHDLPCLELFRRAVVERADDAWAAVFAQYGGMVRGWVRQHPAAPTRRDDDDYWANRAFERFWGAVGPERFPAFPGVAALLRYLKLCVGSVLLDEARGRAAARVGVFDAAAEASRPAPDVAEQAAAGFGAQALWAAILAETRDAAEERVAYLCFVLDLKPHEVAAGEPGLFAGVADVYRIKRNLIERLRRNDRLRDWLG